MANNLRFWVIRAGKKGAAQELFLEKNTIALAGSELNDLSKIKPTRESFYALYRKLHPDETRAGSSGIAGKFFRFKNEILIGDIVLYPELVEKLVYIGKITGAYKFIKSSEYPHQRTVKWKYAIPKIGFTQSARYELGAARTFYEFKKNKQELIEKMSTHYLLVK